MAHDGASVGSGGALPGTTDWSGQCVQGDCCSRVGVCSSSVIKRELKDFVSFLEY